MMAPARLQSGVKTVRHFVAPYYSLKYIHGYLQLIINYPAKPEIHPSFLTSRRPHFYLPAIRILYFCTIIWSEVKSNLPGGDSSLCIAAAVRQRNCSFKEDDDDLDKKDDDGGGFPGRARHDPGGLGS
jgi:hypothetical protein